MQHGHDGSVHLPILQTDPGIQQTSDVDRLIQEPTESRSWYPMDWRSNAGTCLNELGAGRRQDTQRGAVVGCAEEGCWFSLVRVCLVMAETVGRCGFRMLATLLSS